MQGLYDMSDYSPMIFELPPAIAALTSELSLVSGRDDNWVYSARFGGLPAAIKVTTTEAIHVRERGCLIALRPLCTVSVPRVLFAGRSGKYFILIEEWISGEVLGQLLEAGVLSLNEHLAFEFGAALGKLHVSVSSGDLANADFWTREGYNHLTVSDWKTYLGNAIRKWRSRLQLDGELEARRMQQSSEELLAWASSCRVSRDMAILHSDFQFQNIMYDRGSQRITGILDFEHVLAGDPLFDLAKPLISDLVNAGSGEFASYLEGWSKVTNTDLNYVELQMYARLHGLAAVAWVDKQYRVSDANLQFRKRGKRALLEGVNC